MLHVLGRSIGTTWLCAWWAAAWMRGTVVTNLIGVRLRPGMSLLAYTPPDFAPHPLLFTILAFLLVPPIATKPVMLVVHVPAYVTRTLQARTCGHGVLFESYY